MESPDEEFWVEFPDEAFLVECLLSVLEQVNFSYSTTHFISSNNLNFPSHTSFTSNNPIHLYCLHSLSFIVSNLSVCT